LHCFFDCLSSSGVTTQPAAQAGHCLELSQNLVNCNWPVIVGGTAPIELLLTLILQRLTDTWLCEYEHVRAYGIALIYLVKLCW
jgi:hypothetical protein